MESNMRKFAAACAAATSVHACVLMFITNQQQHDWEGKKCGSIARDREFDLGTHINPRLHYSYDRNMQEIRTLDYWPGAQ